jgi:Cys-rich repeat protein
MYNYQFTKRVVTRLRLPVVFTIAVSAVLAIYPFVAFSGSAKLGEPCSVNEECSADLFCYGTPRLCRPVSSGKPTDEGMNRLSTGKEMPPCQNDSDCPHGFRCSTTRNDEGLGGCGASNEPCQSDKDCATGSQCVSRNGKSFCDQIPDEKK